MAARAVIFSASDFAMARLADIKPTVRNIGLIFFRKTSSDGAWPYTDVMVIFANGAMVAEVPVKAQGVLLVVTC